MSNNFPLFSVVTSVKNAIQYIEGSIANVLSQNYPNIEYIIVDGFSNDGTFEYIEKYRDKVTKIVRQHDSGIYEGMNRGIQEASGEWIHLLNVDDRYNSPKSISDVIPLLDHNRLNYCDMFMHFDNGEVRPQFFPFKKWKLLVSAFLPHPGLIVSKEQYMKYGLYRTDYKIASDHELIMRLLKHYKPNHIKSLFTTMKRGGLSEKNFKTSIDEFRKISIDYGCPHLIANLIAKYKKYKWSKVL